MKPTFVLETIRKTGTVPEISGRLVYNIITMIFNLKVDFINSRIMFLGDSLKCIGYSATIKDRIHKIKGDAKTLEVKAVALIVP